MKKWLKGIAFELPPGLMCPNPANPRSENDLPANLFAACTPQSVINLHCLFNMSFYIINKHFDMFLKNKACMCYSYLFVCARKHESTFPTNICTTVGRKTH